MRVGHPGDGLSPGGFGSNRPAITGGLTRALLFSGHNAVLIQHFCRLNPESSFVKCNYAVCIFQAERLGTGWPKSLSSFTSSRPVIAWGRSPAFVFPVKKPIKPASSGRDFWPEAPSCTSICRQDCRNSVAAWNLAVFRPAKPADSSGRATFYGVRRSLKSLSETFQCRNRANRAPRRRRSQALAGITGRNPADRHQIGGDAQIFDVVASVPDLAH